MSERTETEMQAEQELKRQFGFPRVGAECWALYRSARQLYNVHGRITEITGDRCVVDGRVFGVFCLRWTGISLSEVFMTEHALMAYECEEGKV